MDLFAVSLVATTVWKAIDGNKWVESAFTGILGNRADWAYGKLRQTLVNRLRNGQIVNHDIQRAVHEAYLNATLLACQACQQPLERSKWSFAANDAFFSAEAKSLRKINSYLVDELEKFRDVNYVPASALAVHKQEELLLSPAESNSADQARRLKEQVLAEIAALFAPDTTLTVPNSFRKSILEGWDDGKGQQDWFEWVCGFFHEYLKTRPRLSEILQKQWLAELRIDSQLITVQVTKLEDSLAQMSGQVVDLIAMIKQLDGKTDEILDHSRLIPVILDLLRGRQHTQPPIRAKYLNKFPRYDFARLIGREDELRAIDDHLTQHQMLLIRGMGGAGKTTLARAYLDRARQHNAYEYLAFVPLTRSIANSMLDQLGNSSDLGFEDDPQKPTDERFDALIEALRRKPNLLLVLDNVEDARWAKDLHDRKAALESLDAQVLITGRVRMSEFVQANQYLELGALSPDEAFLLFERYLERTVKPTEKELVEAILEKAFYHAKLIEVIATQCRRNTNLTLTEAKDIVSRRDFRHDELNYPDWMNEQDKTIYQILFELFDTSALSEAEQKLLRYFAVLPAIDIPLEHLAALLDATTGEARKHLTITLNRLAHTAWLDQLDTNYFSMHGLVQWAVRERLKPTLANCNTLIAKTAGLIYRLNEANALTAQPYIVYADQLLVYFDADDNGPLTTLYNNIAVTYGALGQHDKRLEYNRKALAILEAVLDEKHPDLATSFNNIAETYRALGQHDKALDYNRKALAIREAILDQKHPDLAQSFNNIAATYGALGQHDKALDYNHKALAILEAVLDEKHPDLAQSFNNIAVTYGALGQHDKELEYDRKALAIREAILDQKHPDLALSFNNIAATYGALGQHDKRLEYNHKALAILKAVLDEKHPDLARSFNNIAATYGALGQHDKELEYDRKALAIREAILDQKHPDLALSFNNIAVTYYYVDELDKALAYMQRAVAIREQVLPPDHPDLLSSQRSLAFLKQAIEDRNREAG